MKSETSGGSNSVVSRSITVEGQIHGNENMTVAGTVKGSLKVDGDVLVDGTGVVEADIEANNVVVRGKVTGDVTARNVLEVHPKGELYGTIRARLINIREGAVFEGRSKMIRSPAAAKSAASKKKKAASKPAADVALEGKAGMASG